MMSTEKNNKEKLALGGALVGGLMFFGFLSQAPLKGLNEKHKADESTQATELPSKPTQDKRTSTFQQDKYDALNSKYKNLEKKYSDDRYAASEKIGKLKRENEKSLSELADAKDYLAQLKKKNKELVEMSKGDGAENADKIARLKAENKEYRATLAEVEKTLRNTFGDGITLEEVKGNIEALIDENKKLKRSFEDEKFILERQNQSLKAQVNQFRAAKNVFVESADLLPKKAQDLLTDLKGLEGKKTAEVTKAYQNLAQKHGAVSMMTISFATGSSELTPEVVAKIKEAATKADSKAYFFVVGYADKTGDAEGNQKLSSARATATAKELTKSSKGFQAAQAYYLGQTDRFGPNEKNRIVEIWILK